MAVFRLTESKLPGFLVAFCLMMISSSIAKGQIYGQGSSTRGGNGSIYQTPNSPSNPQVLQSRFLIQDKLEQPSGEGVLEVPDPPGLKELEEKAKEKAKDDEFEGVDLDELAKKVAEIQKKNQPYTAEYDGGFKISPRDKKKTPFELKINGRLQFRWAGFNRDSSTFTNRLGTIDVPTRNDFEVERGRLELKGFAVDPRIKYLSLIHI